MKRKTLIVLIVIFAVAAGIAVVYGPPRYVIPILMYHRIETADKEVRTSVSPASFARQMDFLARHRYRVIPLTELTRRIRRGEAPPRHAVVITFDDGYEDNYREAYPVLARHDFPATIFVIAGLVGKPDYLTWEQLREMQGKNIAVGSHSVNHFRLTELAPADARREIVDSRRLLEEKLQREVTLFCYPLGGASTTVETMVAEAGYAGACITKPRPAFRPDDVFALPRLRISASADNLFVFWIKTSGYYFWLKRDL